MKKMMIVFAAIAVAAIFSGCTSLRTPERGKNAGKVYYNTIFGLSIESAAYGDGLIVK